MMIAEDSRGLEQDIPEKQDDSPRGKLHSLIVIKVTEYCNQIWNTLPIDSTNPNNNPTAVIKAWGFIIQSLEIIKGNKEMARLFTRHAFVKSLASKIEPSKIETIKDTLNRLTELTNKESLKNIISGDEESRDELITIINKDKGGFKSPITQFFNNTLSTMIIHFRSELNKCQPNNSIAENKNAFSFNKDEKTTNQKYLNCSIQ